MKEFPQHISKAFKLIILSLIVLSCANQDVATSELKEGKYAWKEQSKLAMALNELVYGRGTIIGDTLTLIDSVSFHTISCGNFGYGKYKIEGDSLYLNYDSTGKRYDSSMFYEKYTEVYYIEDSNTVTSEFRVKKSLDSDESRKVMSRLHYIGGE